MIVIWQAGTGTWLNANDGDLTVIDVPDDLDCDDVESFCEDAPYWRMPTFTRNGDRLTVKWPDDDVEGEAT